MSNSFCICIYSLFRAIFVWPWNENTRTKQNIKRKEIERFEWFIERIQTGMALGWLSKHSGEIKTFMPESFPEINWYFALTSYSNTIGQSNNVFCMLGFFSLAGERRVHVLIFDKTNNEHLAETIFWGHRKIALSI